MNLPTFAQRDMNSEQEAESLIYSPDTRFYPLDGRCTRRWRGRGWVGRSHRLSPAYSRAADPQRSPSYKDRIWTSPDDTQRKHTHHITDKGEHQSTIWSYILISIVVIGTPEPALNSGKPAFLFAAFSKHDGRVDRVSLLAIFCLKIDSTQCDTDCDLDFFLLRNVKCNQPATSLLFTQCKGAWKGTHCGRMWSW